MKDTILKLFMGTISEKEFDELKGWLTDSRNRSILKSYIRNYHDLNLAMLQSNVNEAYEKVAQRIESDEKPAKRLIPRWARYAAAVVLLAAMGLLFQQKFFSAREQPLVIPKEELITLELDNGLIRTIDVSGSQVIEDMDGNRIGEQNENQLSYRQSGSPGKLMFNTVKIPNGKRFQLKLSDGTLVYLNAGSSLRYPVYFRPTDARQVILSGEAYFEVAEDNSRPFTVKAGELNVKVLGTKFNVAAYGEQANIEVVLVEGGVSLNTDNPFHDEPVGLAPGEKGAFERKGKNINVTPVNTSLYTSWMQGQLVFRNMTFDQILVKLERHYNVEIKNRNQEIGDELFNASFNDVEIEEVLSFFNDVHQIDYLVENNKIIIQ